MSRPAGRRRTSPRRSRRIRPSGKAWWSAPGRGWTKRRLQPAEPVVAAVFPVAAGGVVQDRQSDHVLRVLEAELGRDADAERETELGRQHLVGEPERHLR